MKSNVHRNMLALALAGLTLVLVNAAVWMAAGAGRITPINNTMLLGPYAVLNICALLWAVSMLGLRPSVLAFSYAAGGLLAFAGVRSIPETGVAEAISAGAVFSAFGALLVCNAAAKTRQPFFTKRQAPYVYIITALLLLNGLLISGVFGSGWNAVSKAVVYPFFFSGMAVGAVWMVSVRCLAGRKHTAESTVENEVPAEEEESSIPEVPAEEGEAGGLMFAVPEDSEVPESAEETEPEFETEVPPAEPPERIMREAASVDVPAEENAADAEYFFPLEIDNGDEVEVQENPDLLGVAAMVAGSAVPPVDDEAGQDIKNPLHYFPDVPSIRETDSEPEDDAGAQKLEAKQAGSDDWLSNHMNLLNKLGK